MNNAKTILDSIVSCDTTKIDTVYRMVLDSVVTNSAKLEAQQFYIESFDKIQSSYNTFLVIVGIFIAITGIIVAIFVGLLAYYNRKAAKNLDMEFEKTNKKIQEMERDLKEQMEKQNDEFQKQIKQLELSRDNINRESMQKYLLSAKSHTTDTDWLSHFTDLSRYFELFSEIKLYDLDSYFLGSVIDFTNSYPKDNMKRLRTLNGRFLRSFLKFKKHCEDSGNNKIIEVVNKLHDILRDLFGGDEGISNDIENFGK